MKSVCFNSQRTLQLRTAVHHQSALSMHPVDRSTRVSNFGEQSCIREINTAKRAKNCESMQLANGTLHAPEVSAGVRREKLSVSRRRLITHKNFYLDAGASVNHAGN
jgi:hypothetical protein